MIMSRKLVVLAMLAGLAAGAMAGESPRFRGPNGDGRFDETGLLKSWPEGGPAVAWVAKGLGKGYSSISVAAGKIYVSGMTADEMGHVYVLGLDGKQQADIPYAKETIDKQAQGPRSTPSIDGNRIYLLSGLGVLYCLDADKKATLWQVNILDKFQGEMNSWTLAESPLLDGNNVICTPGGKLGGVVALDKMTGETVWATTGIDDQASYCTCAIFNHNGHRILVTETAKFVVGINADTGALLWKHPHATEFDIHAVTPIYKDGLIYYTGGYKSGGGALELSQDGASVTSKWTDLTLDCQHHGVVLVDGYLYGTGHSSNNALVCLDMATGKPAWVSEEVKQGATVFADGMLYVYEGPKSGIVDLITPSKSGLELAGRFTVTEGAGNHWAHPVIADGKLFVRHGDSLIAYDIKAK